MFKKCLALVLVIILCCTGMPPVGAFAQEAPAAPLAQEASVQESAPAQQAPTAPPLTQAPATTPPTEAPSVEPTLTAVPPTETPSAPATTAAQADASPTPPLDTPTAEPANTETPPVVDAALPLSKNPAFERGYAMLIKRETMLYPVLAQEPLVALPSGVCFVLERAREQGAARIAFAAVHQPGEPPETVVGWVLEDALRPLDADEIADVRSAAEGDPQACYADLECTCPLPLLQAQWLAQPATEQPATDQPTETPAAEQPTADQPTETPAVDQPTADQPTETPVTDQPTETPAEDQLSDGTALVQTPLVAILLSGANGISLDDGTEQLTAKPSPEDALLDALVWSSSNELYATVDAQGLVRAQGNGTVVITAQNGEITASKTMRITGQKVPPTAIVLTAADDAQTLSGGKNLSFQAAFTPETTTLTAVKWSVSGSEYASISQTGKVNLRANKLSAQVELTVRATSIADANVVGEYMLTALPNPSSATISQSEATLYFDKNADAPVLELSAKLLPQDAPQDLRWSTSNVRVAAVENGMVTAVGSGTAVITACSASYTNVRAKCTVRVCYPAQSVTISAAGNADHLLIGRALSLSAKVAPSTSTDRSVVWTVDVPDERAKPYIAVRNGVVNVNGRCPVEGAPYAVTVTAAARGANPAGEPVVAQYQLQVYAPITMLALQAATTIIDLGADDRTLTLQPVYTPNNANVRKGVDWRSSNTRVATVTDGVVTGLAAGTSTITATAQDGTGRSARINISVGTAVRSIDLVSATGGTQVAAGRSLQLTANVQPTNASNRKVIWSSSDPALATVASTSGKVTARAGKTGTVIITATAADGSGVTNQLTLSLVPATASVVITPGPQYTLDLNNEKTVQFSSVCLPEQAMQNVVWRTNSSAFTIDQNGLATASRKGSYIVTATAQDGTGRRASVRVTVGMAVQSISLGENRQLAAGRSIQLTADVQPSGASNRQVSWTSSDPTIATVSGGRVTARAGKAGTVTITATAKDGTGVEGTCSVEIVPAALSVVITPGPICGINIASDPTLHLDAACVPAGAAQAVTWRSNSSGLTVDAEGNLTALRPGSYFVTATAQDGTNRRASVRVNAGTMVETIEVTSVPAGVREVASGRSVRLNASVQPNSANWRGVLWSSSDPALATVNAVGKVSVRPGKTGKVIITAAAMDGGGAADEYALELLPAVNSVTITPGPSCTLDFTVEQSVQFTAACSPEGSAQSVSWRSNSPYLTIDQTGKATAARQGSYMITATATDGTGRSGSVRLNVSALAKSVEIASSATELASGKSMMLRATVLPAQTANKQVRWSCDNEKLATVSASSGRVSARPGVLGEVTIRATAMDGSGVYAEQKIQIMPAVVRVELTPGLGFVMDLETAQPVQLSAACLPKEAAQTVTWRSSNPNYADVDANGILTAKRVGTVLVTATAADGTGRYATLRVTVGKTVKELVLTGAEQLTAGQSTMLMASFTPKDASIRTLRWTSDQPSIASVSSSGQVRTMAGRYGEALITATATDGSGASATHRVTVMAAVTGVTITAPKTTLDMNDPADMALQLTAACNEGAPSGIQWSTSNAAIATVDETGLVTPHAGGEVIILAKSAANASRWASVKLTILAKAAEVSVSWAGLTWYPQFSVYALNCTRTVTLKATVAPANANQTVTWSSSDPSIARIDAQTGALEALSDGLVTITATAAGGMVGTLKVWSRDEATLLMPYLTCAWQSGADGIYLAWQPVSGARARARYCVYLDGEYIELPAGQMSYTATGLSVGKHSLAVTPMVELGGVAFAQSFTSGDVRMVHVSKIAGDAYLAPTALVAAAPNPYTAELRWSPANPQALPHGYTIESLQQGVWVKLQTTQELSVRLTGQPAGERIYRVAPLVNATGGVQTGLYATVRVTILASENSQYLPPVGLYAMSSEANTVALAWTPADPLNPPDRYVIYRKNGAAWVEVGTSALGKATLTSQPGGGQTYRVNAQVLEQGQYHTGMAGAEVVVAVKAVSKYRALLVGQQNYAQSLVGIDDDLAAMTEVLTHGKTAYEVNSTMNLSKSGIFNAIQSTFAGASSEDVSLFYYGGHGANSVDNNVRGALYLTSSEYLTGAELANALNKVPGTVIVILESCFSGNTIWDGTRARTLTPEPTDEDLSGFNHSMINAFSAYGRAAARSGELRTQKFHVLTTAAQNQNGLEFQYNNGVGFGLLTRGLAQCAGYLFIDANKGYQWAGSFVADEDGDGCITVAEAYSCAKPLVKNWAYNTIVGGKPQAHTQDVQVWPSNSTQPLLFR